MYSVESRIGYSEVDENRSIRIVSLINHLQDCSCFQMEDLGVGVEHQAEGHFAWVLAAIRIEIDRLPGYCERIRTSTWCHTLNRRQAGRNFSIHGEDGAMIVRADSLWTTFDVEAKRICAVPESEQAYYEGDEHLALPAFSRKVSPQGEGVAAEPFAVAEHNIDTNQHVNNAQYVQMAFDALAGAGRHVAPTEVRAIAAQYRAQARLGDVVTPVIHDEGDALCVSLNGEGVVYAVVRVEI